MLKNIDDEALDHQLWEATAAPWKSAALTTCGESYTVNLANFLLLPHVQRGTQERESKSDRERDKQKMWEGTESISLLLAQLYLSPAFQVSALRHLCYKRNLVSFLV